MNMNIQNIFLVISLIFMVIMYTKIITLEKKSLENFGNDNIEHLSNTDEEKVIEIIKREYNHDVEAIRNLGAISKSLLTGKNYHNSDVTLSSIGYTSTPGSICNAGSSDQISTVTTEDEAKTSCTNNSMCNGFTKKSDTEFILYKNINGISVAGASAENSCSLKQSIEGTLENNHLTIPANLKVLGWSVAVPQGTVIMWSMSTPPPPNTVSCTSWSNIGETQTYPDTPTNCWYPCIGGTINGISIPDLRGRSVVGQGRTSGKDKDQHDKPDLLSQIGGEVPLKHHGHYMDHAHTVHGGGDKTHYRGAWKPGAETGSEGATRTTASNNRHWTGNASHSGPGYDTNWYGKDTFPDSIVLQFWIRVR